MPFVLGLRPLFVYFGGPGSSYIVPKLGVAPSDIRMSTSLRPLGWKDLIPDDARGSTGPRAPCSCMVCT